MPTFRRPDQFNQTYRPPQLVVHTPSVTELRAFAAERLNAIPPAVTHTYGVGPTMHVAASPLPTDSLGHFGYRMAAFAPLVNADSAPAPQKIATLRERFRHLPQAVKDTLLKVEGFSTVDDLLNHYASLPSGYAASLTGHLVTLEASWKQRALGQEGTKAEQAQARAYLFGTFQMLPPNQEGQGGYYFNFKKPGLSIFGQHFLGDIANATSVLQNVQIGGLEDLVAGTVALPFQYAAHAIHEAAGEAAPGQLYSQDPWGGGKVPSVTEAWRRNVFAGTDAFGQSRAGLGGQIGRIAASASGLNPDDPANATAVSIFTVVGDFYMTGAAGGALRGVRLGSQTISAYKDYLALADTAKAEGLTDAAKAYRAQAAEVLQSVSPHVSTRIGFMLSTKTPEDLFATRKGLQLVDEINARIRMGATASDLSKTYRDLPVHVAQSLTGARSPEDVASIMVSAARGETQEGVKAIESRIAEIDARIDLHTKQGTIATAEDLFGAGGVGTTPDGVLHPSTVAALIDERRFQMSKLRNAITPTFAPIEKMPHTGPVYRAMQGVTDSKFGNAISWFLHAHIPLPFVQRIDEGDAGLAVRASVVADDQVQAIRAAMLNAQEAGDAQGAYSLADQLVQAENHANKLEATAIRLERDTGKLQLQWLRTSPSISRFWEEAHDNRIWDLTQEHSIPADALESNIANVDKMLVRLGTTAQDRRRISEMFVRLKDAPDKQAAFDAIMKDIGRTAEMAPLVDRRAGAVFGSFYDANEMERRRGGITVFEDTPVGPRIKTEFEPTIYRNERTDSGAPLKVHLAQGPEEMRLFFNLPSYSDVVEATGYWRRVLRAMEETKGVVPRIGGAVGGQIGRVSPAVGRSVVAATQRLAPLRALAKTWRISSRTMDVATQAWKNLIILGRSAVHIRGTPIGQFQLRVVGEENLRAAAYGQVSFFSHPAEWFRLIRKYGDLQGFLGDDFARIVGHVSRDIGDTVARGSSALYYSHDPGYLKALSQRFALRNKNPLWRFFAGEALGTLPPEEPNLVDKALAWLDGNGFEATAYKEVVGHNLEVFRKALEEDRGVAVTSEEALREWVTRIHTEFSQVTAGHPGALAAIRTGKAKLTEFSDAQRADLMHISIDRASVQHRLRYEVALPNPDWVEVDRLKLAEKALDDSEQAVMTQDVKSVEVGTPEFQNVLEQWRRGEGYTAPVAVAGDPARENVAISHIRRATDWMYRHWVTKPDVRFARGPVFGQMFEREVARLEAMDWPTDLAVNRAKIWAGKQTRDMMYDLATRTSSQRFFRNLFPFGAAWQEIGETWAWKIPRTMYPGLGHVYLARRAQELGAMLKILGVDPNRKQFIPLHGLFQAFLGLTGTGITPELGFYPQSANLLTQSIGPGLGPLPNVVLSQLVKHHAPGAEAVSNALQPFGTDIQLGPANLNRLFEATFHRPAPWEVASPDLQQQLWDASVWDATQEGAVKFKDGRPKLADYPKTTLGQQAYDEALTRWTTKVHDWAEGQAGKFALIRFALSSFSPVNFSVTDNWQRDMAAMNNTLGPLYRRDPSDPRIDAAWVNFYKDHPGAELYGSPPQLVNHRDLSQNQQKDATAYYKWLKDQAAKGNVQNLTPDQAIKYGLYLASEHWHQYRLKLLMTQAGGGIGVAPMQQAANILENYGGYKAQLQAESDRWSAYQAFNFTAASIRQTYLKTLKGGDFPSRTLDQQRIADLLKLVGESQVVLEEGGMKPSDVAKLKAQVIQAGDKLGLMYGAPTDPVAKAMQWWFDKVYGPHFAQVSNLYAQIDVSPSDQRSPLFEKIRELANKDLPVVYQGVTFPSVQQFQWNEKTLPEQQAMKLKWVTRPTEWLTSFQQGKLGLPDSKAASDFFDSVNAALDEMKTNLAAITGTGSDQRKADYKKSVLDYIAGQAAKRGLSDAWKFSQMLPYQRILTANLFGNDKTFGQVAAAVDTIRQRIIAQGFVPGGGSQLDLYYRQWLFGAIDDYRAKNPNSPFDKQMKQLEEATAPAGQAHRPGPDMYMAVFFDNWYGDRSGYASAIQTAATFGATETVTQFMNQYRNGYVPMSALTDVGGVLVSNTIAENVRALMQAAIAAGALRQGAPIGTQGYRSYSQQVSGYQRYQAGQGALHARPGTSMHGWGLAIDFNLNNISSAWLRANASRFGLYNLPSEPWHYSINGN